MSTPDSNSAAIRCHNVNRWLTFTVTRAISLSGGYVSAPATATRDGTSSTEPGRTAT